MNNKLKKNEFFIKKKKQFLKLTATKTYIFSRHVILWTVPRTVSSVDKANLFATICRPTGWCCAKDSPWKLRVKTNAGTMDTTDLVSECQLSRLGD